MPVPDWGEWVRVGSGWGWKSGGVGQCVDARHAKESGRRFCTLGDLDAPSGWDPWHLVREKDVAVAFEAGMLDIAGVASEEHMKSAVDVVKWRWGATG